MDRDLALSRLARRAYEKGRLREASKVLVFTVTMTAFAFAVSDSLLRTAVFGGALSIAAVALLWRGRDAGRGVAPGLFAGVLPLGLPLAMRSCGHCCIGGACWSTCLVACIAAGLAAGGVIGLWAAAQRSRSPSFVVAALGIAVLGGAMGCTFAGGAGVLGMAVGLLAGTAPVLVFARARST
jgi:hypothetical protein